MKGMIGRAKSDREAAPSFDEQAFIAAYRERFVEFHLAWTIFFVSHLSTLRRHMDDLEDALLLAAIGLGPAAAKLKAFQETQDASHLAYGAPVGEPAVTNAVRLSELTNIPRQTVRRKLQSFAKRGWLEQMPDSSWRLARKPDNSATVAKDLNAANKEFLRELSQLLGRFDRLLCSPPGSTNGRTMAARQDNGAKGRP